VRLIPGGDDGRSPENICLRTGRGKNDGSPEPRPGHALDFLAAAFEYIGDAAKVEDLFWHRRLSSLFDLLLEVDVRILFRRLASWKSRQRSLPDRAVEIEYNKLASARG
jgi:hypothetical protein